MRLILSRWICNAAISLCALCALLTGSPALSQEFPVRPIRLFVGASAGGVTDIVARVFGEKMSRFLGQPVTVENKTGAAGVLAVEAILGAPADGHTWVISFSGPIVLRPFQEPKLSWDPFQVLQPVSQLYDYPLFLVARPDFPAASAAEVIALLKQNPGKFNYGAVGRGASTHLAGELFQKATGTSVELIDYKGESAMLPDLISGRLDLGMVSPVPAIQFGNLKSGGIKVVASTTKRLDKLPNVIAVAELGYPNFSAGGWGGLFVRAGTPMHIVQKIHGAAEEAAKDMQAMTKLTEQGVNPMSSSPAEFQAYIATEARRWAPIVRELAKGK